MDHICKVALDMGNDSINDDLEGFISDLQKNSLRPDTKWLHFFPKFAARGSNRSISEIEKRQYRHFCIFLTENPDVSEEEMTLSESKSKYCYSVGWRKTIIFENFEKVIPNSGLIGQKRKINDAISQLDIHYGYLGKNRLKSKNK